MLHAANNLLIHSIQVFSEGSIACLSGLLFMLTFQNCLMFLNHIVRVDVLTVAAFTACKLR